MKKFSFILCLVLVAIIASILYFSSEITYYFESAKDYLSTNGTSVSSAEPLLRPVETDSYKRNNYMFGLESLQTEDQRTAYTEIVKKLKSISDETATLSKDDDTVIGYRSNPIVIPVMSRNSIDFVLSAVKEDYPEAFWISNSYYYREKLRNIELGFVSYLSNDQIPIEEARFNAAISGILQSVPPGLSEYEREVFLHDWIVQNCEYNSAAVGLPFQDMSAATAYGVIISRTTVCNGYARAFKLLLREVGIPSVLINGDTDQGAHIWNAVLLDGQWYHTDVTWNDPSNIATAEHLPFYYYLNLTDDQIKRNHIIFPLYSEQEKTDTDGVVLEMESDSSSNFNIYLPVCNSDTLNYYRINGVLLFSADADGLRSMSARIGQMRESGSFVLSVMFSSDLNAVETKDWLVNSGIRESIRLANQVSNHFSESYFSFYYDPAIRDDVIIVILKAKEWK